MYEIYKRDLADIDKLTLIKSNLDTQKKVTSFLASIPEDDIWLYEVIEWGQEDKEHIETTCAEEWAELPDV